MNKKKILSLILCCFMVLFVGCSGTGLTSEQKQIAKECMDCAEYIYENGFPDTLVWEEGEEEELYNKLFISDEVLEVITHTSESEFNQDMFDLTLLGGDLLSYRDSLENVVKGEEVSAPHHKFVKKYNEVNEKYNLRYKPIG